MENKDLSKHRYIYRVYASSDYVIHCEKYPIIYVNSKIVYFKTARLEEKLSVKQIYSINNEYTGITPNDICNGYYDKYFWKVENFDSQKASNDAFRLKRSNELTSAKYHLESIEKEYLKQKELLEQLKKKYGVEEV